MTPLRRAIGEATTRLSEAGIDSAANDAALLAAHVAGTDRGRLACIDDPGPAVLGRYREAVLRRAQRVPLQHITGIAAFGPVRLVVGPGVFTPRPETESLLEWAQAQNLGTSPVIVDLCTGSGALALALAAGRPAARVIAVDDDPVALGYARRNAEGSTVEVVAADVTAAGLLPALSCGVDLVVANPPYLPAGCDLEPEVALGDPPHALYGGSDGMALIGPIAAHAARWLRPGGLLAVEHDDTTASATVEVVSATGAFGEVTPRRDLTGRPRFVTARRSGGGPVR
jgi:release factor glutamine methyltransferase